MSSNAWTFVPMAQDDLAEVLQIEKNLPSSWSLPQLEGEFLQGCGSHLVARNPGSNRLVGYLFSRIITDEAEIIKLAVPEEYRRQGIAAGLLDRFFALLEAQAVRTCHLEFRHSNLAAQRLYEKNKFCVTGRRKNYYNDPTEDAICMKKNIDICEEPA